MIVSNIVMTRVYRDNDSYKITRVKLVNINTFEVKEYTAKVIKELIKNNNIYIYNLELDDKGQLKVRDTNPKKKIKHYAKLYISESETAYQYCLIADYNRDNTLKFIADCNDEQIIAGDSATLGEIAGRLGLRGLEYLDIANAFIDVTKNSEVILYIYKNDCYHRMTVLVHSKLKNLFSDDIDYEIMRMSQSGIFLKYFEHLNGVGTFEIPQGICYLEKFRGGVNDLIIPDSMRAFGEECFEGSEDLYRITLGRGLKDIPFRCFYDSLIEDIKFSDTIETIGEEAFSDCMYLRGPIVTNAKFIGKNAFEGSAIRKVNLTGAHTIDICAFSFCDKLESVKLNDGLKYIKGGAFSYCGKLKEIKIPSSVVRIGKQAFSHCGKLKTVHISKDTIIGEKAFPRRTEVIKY